MTGAWLLWLFMVMAHDFGRRRAPNWLALLGVALALVALTAGLQPFGLGWTDALSASAMAFGVMLLFHLAGLMGAGDVKFAAALGLWVGIQAVIAIWVVASLMAALHAIALLALRRWPVWPRLALVLSGVNNKAQGRREKPVPYAAYMAISSVGWAAWG